MLNKDKEKNAKSVNGRRNRMIRFKEAKGGKCSLCGYDKNYACLDFHHLDPKLKSFPVNTQGMDTHGVVACGIEVQKCILLCRNCHTDLHFKEMRKKQELI